MARAFIQQGVWRMSPARDFDPLAQRSATLRVSIAAAVTTLIIASVHDIRSTEGATSRPAPAVRISAPEIVAAKIDDRVTAIEPSTSMLRRRALVVEAEAQEKAKPIETTAAETTATLQPAQPRAPVSADGGMIRAGDTLYRLGGIDLPESTRQCRRLDGLAVNCLDRAQSYLQLLVKGRAVSCERLPQRTDGAAEATCKVGDADIAEQLVRQGWARAADRPEERFLMAEAAAKRQKLGIWRD
jgi:endonuclease YncB( thermonuclease family)